MQIYFVEKFKEYLEYITNYILNTSNNENQNENNQHIQQRMKTIEKNYNSQTCHPFKPHVFSLKSKKILSYINSLTSVNEKITLLKTYNNIINKVCTQLYDRFDPNLIYTFNNEIHLIFYYNDDGNYLYDGNINKTLTLITSYASTLMYQQLKENDINLDFMFECSFVEFNVDYECLNYIVWRQLDCKRNLTTLFYRCHKNEKCIDFTGVKIKEIQNELFENYPNLIDDMEELMFGTIIKKKIVNNENSEKLQITPHYSFSLKEGFEITKESDFSCERKQIVHSHFWLHEDFEYTMEMYVINKFLFNNNNQ